MKTLWISILAICLGICLDACGSKGGDADTAAPRRPGYARLPEYAPAYAPLDSLPLLIEVNAQARTRAERRADGSIWLNIDYPAYNASIYCTLTPVDAASVEAALENRAERIALNLGGASTESEHFLNPAGYYATLVKAPTAMPSPVHFLAVEPDSPRWLVSGSAFFSDVGPQAPADSIAPAIEVLLRDSEHLLTRLAPLQ